MGSSQSARKLTIVNEEDDVNVIRISDAVAKRLAQNAEIANQKEAAALSTQAINAPVHATAATSIPVRNAVTVQEVAEGFYPAYTISALEMQQQKEKELESQELYWKRRLQNLEKAHERINKSIDEEYKKALGFFDDCRVVKNPGPKLCEVNRTKVLKCYETNPKETLRCADLVEQFSNCVDQHRAQLMQCN